MILIVLKPFLLAFLAVWSSYLALVMALLSVNYLLYLENTSATAGSYFITSREFSLLGPLITTLSIINDALTQTLGNKLGFLPCSGILAL